MARTPTVIVVGGGNAALCAAISAAEHGAKAVVASHWANGGAGTEDLAREVVAVVESGEANFKPLYPDDMSLWDKVKTIATEIYGASDISADQAVRNRFAQLQESYGRFPVCMAKTQKSLSDTARLRGRPRGFRVRVNEVVLSAGAGFVVAICGKMMTMPGLPKEPAAVRIRVDDDGRVTGLS